jgi:hypothetical protein
MEATTRYSLKPTALLQKLRAVSGSDVTVQKKKGISKINVRRGIEPTSGLNADDHGLVDVTLVGRFLKDNLINGLFETNSF